MQSVHLLSCADVPAFDLQKLLCKVIRRGTENSVSIVVEEDIVDLLDMILDLFP